MSIDTVIDPTDPVTLSDAPPPIQFVSTCLRIYSLHAPYFETLLN